MFDFRHEQRSFSERLDLRWGRTIKTFHIRYTVGKTNWDDLKWNRSILPSRRAKAYECAHIGVLRDTRDEAQNLHKGVNSCYRRLVEGFKNKTQSMRNRSISLNAYEPIIVRVLTWQPSYNIDRSISCRPNFVHTWFANSTTRNIRCKSTVGRNDRRRFIVGNK